jgi:hypothetical protein
VECSVNYADEVNTKEDLLAHLSPEWVNAHLENAADALRRKTDKAFKDTPKPLNVQQRLMAREYALQGLAALLRRRPDLLPHLAAVRAALQGDLERVQLELGEKP